MVFRGKEVFGRAFLGLEQSVTLWEYVLGFSFCCLRCSCHSDVLRSLIIRLRNGRDDLGARQAILVACFAASSASSFPSTLVWPGTQWSLICMFGFRCSILFVVEMIRPCAS